MDRAVIIPTGALSCQLENHAAAGNDDTILAFRTGELGHAVKRVLTNQSQSAERGISLWISAAGLLEEGVQDCAGPLARTVIVESKHDPAIVFAALIRRPIKVA